MTTVATAEVRHGSKERKRIRLGCDIPPQSIVRT